MKKILAIGAHPDDVEFGCSGILIKEIEAGNQVKIVVCSLGEAGSNGTPEGRRAEATAAAQSIGAEIEFLDMGGDSHIEVLPKNGFKIAEIIRTWKPNIVLAPSLSENQHPDHRAVAQMARSAARFARYGGLAELKALPVHTIDALYYFPSGAWQEKPDVIIDVSAQYDKWVAAMSKHESQMKTKSYLNLVSSKAKAVGASVGVEYAIGLIANDPVQVPKLSDLSLSSRNF